MKWNVEKGSVVGVISDDSLIWESSSSCFFFKFNFMNHAYIAGASRFRATGRRTWGRQCSRWRLWRTSTAVGSRPFRPNLAASISAPWRCWWPATDARSSWSSTTAPCRSSATRKRRTAVSSRSSSSIVWTWVMFFPCTRGAGRFPYSANRILSIFSHFLFCFPVVLTKCFPSAFCFY